jgi:hypothetical protein
MYLNTTLPPQHSPLFNLKTNCGKKERKRRRIDEKKENLLSMFTQKKKG